VRGLGYYQQLFSTEGDWHKEKVMDCLRVVLSVIIPPLGVFLKVGFGLHFWLNIVLTLLGYVPGLVHAVWIIATH
jgi:uncharacterized membrane protein YqaE (UPF0057 family)